MKRLHVYIEGKVQGVGFRHFVKINARQIGVNGWVKNLPDGRVEVVFEGSEAQINEMIECCKQGPRSGRVSNIHVHLEETDHSFEDFQVKYF